MVQVTWYIKELDEIYIQTQIFLLLNPLWLACGHVWAIFLAAKGRRRV